MKIYLILEKYFNENFRWSGYSIDQKFFLYKDLEYAEQIVRRKTIELFRDLIENKEYAILDYEIGYRNKVQAFVDKHSIIENIPDYQSTEDILDEIAKNDDFIIEYLRVTDLSFYDIKETEFDDILA